jgi:DNA replication protein DnaC
LHPGANRTPGEAPVACLRCHDAGMVKRLTPDGHLGGPEPEDHYELAVCVCKRRDVAAKKADRVQRASSLTTEMDTMTFASYDRGWDADAYQAAWTFAEEIAAATTLPFLAFSGQYGSGKTHLLAAIAQHLLGKGRQPLFVVVPKLLDWLRAGFTPEKEGLAYEQRFAGICDADVLLLDDLGAEQHTPWAQEKLFQLINHRYARRLPTVISTNWLLADLDGRIADRLLDVAVCAVVYTVDRSYRQRPERGQPRAPQARG